MAGSVVPSIRFNGEYSAQDLYHIRRFLKEVGPEAEKAARKELRAIAIPLRTEIRAQVPKKTGRAAKSVTSGTLGLNPFIAFPRPKRQGLARTYVPYYPWLDFGGTLKATPKRPWSIHRPFIAEGRYVYPTIERNRDKIAGQIREAVQAALKRVQGP